MGKNVSSETLGALKEIIRDSKGALPNGENLLSRTLKALRASQFIVWMVSNSGMARPEFWEESYALPRGEDWWAIYDYSVEGSEVSSCDIALGIFPRLNQPLLRDVATIVGFNNHHVAINFSQADRPGEPPLERHIFAADRIPLNASARRHLGKRALEHTLGIDYDIPRTQQELVNSLEAGMEPFMPGSWQMPLAEYYEHVARRFDESIPSEDDLDLLEEKIVPRVGGVLRSAGLKVPDSHSLYN